MVAQRYGFILSKLKKSQRPLYNFTAHERFGAEMGLRK